MAQIRKYIGKCVITYALTFIQMKRDVLGRACDEHIVFFVYMTEKFKVVWKLCTVLK